MEDVNEDKGQERQHSSPEMYTRTKLKERGWTDSIIKKMGLEPDDIRPNPHYKRGPMMKLYLASKVQELEKTGQFKGLIERSRKRRESALKAAEAKRRELLAEIEALEIRVPVIEDPVSDAIDAYNAWEDAKQWNRRQYVPSYADESDDQDFLDRITVNYIRHQLTAYDKNVEGLFNRVGKAEGYVALRNKVLDAIVKAYPDLKDECENQKIFARGVMINDKKV